MDARTTLSNDSGPVARHVAFNAGCAYYSVALDTGFAIFKSDTGEPYLEQDLPGSVGTATMLGSSQMVGLTGGGPRPLHEPRKLVLWDTNRQAESATIVTRLPIVRAVLSSAHIAVVHESGVNVYRHQPQLEKLASYDTSPNPLGLCCVGRDVAVFPGRTAGHIQVMSLATRKVDIIPAHTSALRALALSSDDQVVASASATGTLVRVHATATSNRLLELRRGMGQADIYSIGISPSGTRLAVTSDSSTLHVFDMPTGYANATASQAGSVGQVANVQKWGSLARIPFAPRVFTDLYSFASASFGLNSDVDATHLDSSSLASSSSAKPQKGVIGWLDDETIIVLSAGREACYERFALIDKDGAVGCARLGWSRYLRPN